MMIFCIFSFTSKGEIINEFFLNYKPFWIYRINQIKENIDFSGEIIFIGRKRKIRLLTRKKEKK